MELLIIGFVIYMGVLVVESGSIQKREAEAKAKRAVYKETCRAMGLTYQGRD